MQSRDSNHLYAGAKYLVSALFILASQGVAAAEPAGTGSPPSEIGGAGAPEDEFAVGSRRDLSNLEQSIADQGRTVINAGTRHSTQSDDVDISQHEVSADFFFAEGTHRLSPGVLLVQFNPDAGTTIDQRTAGASGSYRMGDNAAVSGALWFNRVSADDLPADTISTYDFYVTLWPSDLLRFDLDFKREIFDNPTSMRMGITMRSLGASMDINPHHSLRISVRAARSDLSDGNEKWSGEAEGFWRLTASPDMDVGLRVSGFSFSEQLYNGYFNPDDYKSAEAMFRMHYNLSEKTATEFAASAGVEDSNPGGSKSIVKASLRLVTEISEDWALDGGLAYFSSRQSNSSGFARTALKIGVRYKL